jgi:DNA-binding response OmpR family regulator
MKVLIVDDAKENLVALKALLNIENVEIFKAMSGVEALDLLIEHDFCLALLDVQMPGMDGFELARFMRGTNKTKYIPIIFVTGELQDERSFFEGYDLAAISFIRKPLDPSIVRSQVNAFLQIHLQKSKAKS